MPDFTEQAEQIVDLIRSQNWKNGGVFNVDFAEAVALVDQAMRAAYAQGSAEGAREAGDGMLAAFDSATDLGRVVGGPQTEAVKRLVKAGP